MPRTSLLLSPSFRPLHTLSLLPSPFTSTPSPQRFSSLFRFFSLSLPLSFYLSQSVSLPLPSFLPIHILILIPPPFLFPPPLPCPIPILNNAHCPKLCSKELCPGLTFRIPALTFLCRIEHLGFRQTVCLRSSPTGTCVWLPVLCPLHPLLTLSPYSHLLSVLSPPFSPRPLLSFHPQVQSRHSNHQTRTNTRTHTNVRLYVYADL